MDRGHTVERTAEDRERHRQIRERLQFSRTPTVTEVNGAVDVLIGAGLLTCDPRTNEVEAIVHALKTERERQGVSLSELASRAGWDEIALANLESGQQVNASVRELTIWARALGKRLEVSLLDC